MLLIIAGNASRLSDFGYRGNADPTPGTDRTPRAVEPHAPRISLEPATI